MISSNSLVNNQLTTQAKPISVETAELLRIEFEFEHTLRAHRKVALAQKYGLRPSQIEDFFNHDMKEQRDDEIRRMANRNASKPESSETKSDSVEKIQEAQKQTSVSATDTAVPPKVAPKKKRMAKNLVSNAAILVSTGPLILTSTPQPSTSKPKKKVSKTVANRVLRAEFEKNTKLPASRKIEIAEQLGMNPEDVRKYFVNRRAKGIRQWLPKTTRLFPKFKF